MGATRTSCAGSQPCLPRREHQMADFDIQIKGGTIVDGTRVPRYRADLWIKDGKIAQIGGRSSGFAKKVIDADGLTVAPWP